MYRQFVGHPPTPWKTTTAICRTWSSPSKKASCTCSRPATASAPRPRRSRSPWTWWTKEKLSTDEALLRGAQAAGYLLHPNFDPKAHQGATPIAKGLPASPGAAAGKAYFTAKDAANAGRQGIKVILCVKEDHAGRYRRHGSVQGHPHGARRHDQPRGGGRPRHGPPCGRRLRRAAHRLRNQDHPHRRSDQGHQHPQGRHITIDGKPARSWSSAVATVQPQLSGDFASIMAWADPEARRMDACAPRKRRSTPKTARDFGAEGIGLCRTEHRC